MALVAVLGTEVAKVAVKTALGSVVKLIQYEWFLNKTVNDGLGNLQAELNMMQASIGNVSSTPQHQIKLVDKFWANEVKELSCTIETRLQSFIARIDSTKGSFLSGPRKRVIHRQIASFIKDTMIKVKLVGERRGRYDYTSSNTTSAQEAVDPRIYALYTKESDLVGLAEATDELINLLSNFDHVSIVGMGGLGKTTLARVVYDKMKGGFDCCAFVPVGQRAHGKKVLMDILHELRIEIYGQALNERQLIDQLRNSIEGKRCFFVIDDIWDDDNWDLIKCAFVGSPESRIITTTRKLDVAKPVGGVYMIKRLSDANSKELLHTRLFGVEANINDTEYARLSEKILSKCGGVPIAIVTIARLLAKKPRHKWSTVYDSIGFAEHGKEDILKAIRDILYLSYIDLSSVLKKCFLYLSLFPEDHWIEKNMLIWRWVAEGLVPGVELGEKCFDELIDRCMIQRAVSPRDLGQGGCRIHDLMLDLIRDQSSSEKENFSTVLDWKQESTSQALPIRRLAIHGKKVDDNQDNIPPPQKNPTTSLEVGMVQSFYASSCLGSSLPKFSDFTHLRVIDLEYCDLSVGNHKLKHLAKSHQLAYVGLSGTPVPKAELPKKIGGLKLLETLDLTGTDIKELPPFVQELKKLRCLRAGKGTRMLGRVGELTSLEELWLHSADKSPDFAAELRKLAKLRVLVIHFDELDVVMQNVMVESLCNLRNLQILQIWFEGKVGVSIWGDNEPSQGLRQLLLFGVILPKRMPWIKPSCVPRLSKLLLQVATLEAEDLEILGQMPSLVSLYIHSENYLLSYTVGKNEFKVLEYLYTNIELVCGDGALPVIQELEVAGIRVGTDVGLRGNMPLLERASYHLNCNGWLVDVEIEKAEEALRQASQTHPKRPTLSIKRFNYYQLKIIQDQLKMETYHQFTKSVFPELMNMVKNAGFNLGGGGGDEAQFNANFTPSLSRGNIAIHDIMEIIARYAATVEAPPSLTSIDATDATRFPSQTVGGVPRRIRDAEIQVLPTSGSIGQKVASLRSQFPAETRTVSEQFSGDIMLALYRRLFTVERLTAMAPQVGLDPAVLRDLMDNLVRNPEFVSALNNWEFDANGVLSASSISTTMQPMISEFEKHEGSQLRPEGFDTDGILDTMEILLADDVAMSSIYSMLAVPHRPTKSAVSDARKVIKKAIQNPEIVACLENIGGSGSYANISKLAKLMLVEGTDLKTSGPTKGQGKQPAEISGANVSREPTPKAPGSSNATVVQGVAGAAESSEDGENFSRMLKKLLPGVEQALAAGSSSGRPGLAKSDDAGKKALARK